MNLEAEEIGIVFVGNFNPAIFHPEWLLSHKLITTNEYDFAIKKLRVVHKAVSEFRINDDVHLLVTDDRFQLLGDFKYNLQIRDLTSGIFTLLEHCPITAMGVNRSMHFKLGSQQEVADVLNRLSQFDKYSSVIQDPSLKSYEILGKRPDSDDGYILVQISPSARIQPGILIHVNNHHGKDDKKMDLQRLLRKLESSWDEMISYALEIADKILEVGS